MLIPLFSGRVLCTVAAGLLLGAAAVGQDAPPGAAQPATSAATQPASSQPTTTESHEPNPLPTPARMMRLLRDKLAAGALQDAEICLDFSQVDDEVRRGRGAEYVSMLGEILAQLEKHEYFDPADLPDEPTAPTQTIGKDPLLLVLERQEPLGEGAGHRLWRFAASSVADIPRMHEQLAELARLASQEQQPTPIEEPEPDEPLNRLRSPYHMVEFFLVAVAETERDTSAYTEAMKCLDFSMVAPAVVEKDGPRYVDNLARIYAYLRASQGFDRETLEKDPAPEVDSVAIGANPFLMIIVKQPGPRWRFAATTVSKLPDALAQLRKIEAEQDKPATNIAIREDTSSPQATLNMFLTAMNEGDVRTAVRCLDLSHLSEAERDFAGVLAGKLKLVIDRIRVIVPQDVPNDPESSEPFTIEKGAEGRIEIDRVCREDDPRRGEWLFTAATVRDIELLYEFYEKKPVLPEFQGQRLSFWAFPRLYVREYLAPASAKRPLAGLQVWQWGGILTVILLGLIFRMLSMLILPRMSRRLLASEGSAMLPTVLRKALLPTSTFVMVVAWWGGLQFLDLGATILSWTWMTLKIAMTLVGVYAIYRLTDVATGYFTARAAKTTSRLDDVLVPLISKTIRVVVVAVGLVIIATAFGFRVGPLLAGLGVGGLAFGLAAQDTLKNFFGSVNVVLDRPFQVGDWVKIGDAEGTVEAVGLRSSRIRTFYNSQITVPNSDLMTATIDNLGRRRYRRISCHISVTYDTSPEKLDAFCEGIRELIRKHPYTRKDYFHTYVNKFASSSIDILLYCFHETPDWSTELRERHRLYLDIIRLARRLGVEFAFPTQTLHMHQESSPLAESSPLGPSLPTGSEDAERFGRDEAAAIVKQSFGDEIEKPPPVRF